MFDSPVEIGSNTELMDSSMLSSTPGRGGAVVGTEVMGRNFTPCGHEPQQYGRTVTGSSMSAGALTSTEVEVGCSRDVPREDQHPMELTPPVSRFDQAYRDGDPPWVIDEPQPAVVALVGSGAVAGTVLDPGCGTGEHTILLAGLGYDVLGADAAPTAVRRARERAAAARGRPLRRRRRARPGRPRPVRHGGGQCPVPPVRPR
ncbi:methyltransferase domain-containing protein [Pseudonocardia sp. ICBG1034]|uniref:class I SAM-dependent methyltransferase n=1 Tax=Pseudonocardia sp. ICBG1034 TaxID=2844381 RepID=UPI0027DF3410|nr:methyltransferase domain-containing protein [Pseudonocardia sp. ICBG1034]